MRLEREVKEEQQEKELREKERKEREQAIQEQKEVQRMISPPSLQPGMQTAQQGMQTQPGQGSAVPGGILQAERKSDYSIRKRDYSIEDAFEQFSVLQGVKVRLKQFGYDFFDAQASSFAPVQDVPVGPDYVIGPQDSLGVHIWNVPDSNFNRSYIVPVERDGMVVIPQVGAIPVSGLTFSQAEHALRTRLGSFLKRFDLHVTLARLRTIKVYVVGEVVRPGAYEVSALATVSNALYAACGPTRSGSLRQIRLVRDGRTVAEPDFYDFLLAGDRTQDQRLQAGDVIVVPPVGPMVAISGAVRRPAIYELRTGSRLRDLIRLAGGLTPLADHQRCHIFRVEQGRGRVLLDVNLAAAQESQANPLLQDGDYVLISSLPTQVANVVSLVGAVKGPGPYEFRSGMRISDVLSRDQLTADAYLEQAEVIRTDPVTYQTTVILFSPRALFEGDRRSDHQLQRLDQIVIGSQVRPPSIVVVEGEVKRPGSYTLGSGERLSSVLKRAGGFTPNAFPQGIVLIRESVKRKQQAELERFIAAERQRLAAQSAAIAAGTATIAAGASLSTYGSIAEQQVLAMRLQQLEAIVSRLEMGRVVVKMASIEDLEGSEYDIRLEANDKIIIPQPPQTVSVIGSVKNPSTVVYRPGLSLEDYLRQVGGETAEANKREIYVMRANGTTESAYLSSKEMQPGDTIVVPQKIEVKTPQIALWQTVASIIGSMALAAAGIAVIGR